jgi:hypothetical protein
MLLPFHTLCSSMQHALCSGFQQWTPPFLWVPELSLCLSQSNSLLTNTQHVHSLEWIFICYYKKAVFSQTELMQNEINSKWTVQLKSNPKLLYDCQSVSMSWCWAHFGTCDQILLPVGRLLSESWGLVSVRRSLWREDGSAICSAITQWSESRRTCNHILLLIWDSPNLEGQVPEFISPRNRVAQLYPQALGSIYVASYDLHGYGGGILTLPQPGGPGPCIYIPQEQDGPGQSHVTTDSQ